MMPPQGPARLRGGRSVRARLLLLAFGVVFALVAAELFLQAFPHALPAAFRERYPPHGIEFFDRGVLDRTPLTAMPLPYGVEPYDGPPWADIVEMGFAAADAAAMDRAEVPRLVIPADADGLPNTARPVHPDIVLVGDSFTFYAAQREPPGLQRALEERLGVSCLNLGMTGIGPDQELWLLENIGLPARPRVVVWLLFGGNDVLDAYWCRLNLEQGIKTHGDLHKEKRAPRLLLPSLIASWFQGDARHRRESEPLPPVQLGAPHDLQLWLVPDALRLLSVPIELFAANPGMLAVRDVLRRAKEQSAAAGAQLLVVFLPCKEEVYLPHLVPFTDLLYRYAQVSSLYGIPLAADAQQFVAALQRNHAVTESAITAACAAEGIAFWSTTPALTAAMQRGERIFYRADTHWRAEGQLAIAPGLIEQLRALGITGK